MNRWLQILLALLVLQQCCFTCATTQTSRYFSTDDRGIVTTATSNSSGGGLGSIVTGKSSGTRTTTRTEAQQASIVQVGDIRIEGVVDSSTRAGERGFVLGVLARAKTQGDAIKNIVRGLTDQEDSKQATDRARIEQENTTDRARIDSQTEIATQQPEPVAP